jgi:hypothetical protein
MFRDLSEKKDFHYRINIHAKFPKECSYLVREGYFDRVKGIRYVLGCFSHGKGVSRTRAGAQR